MFKKYLLTALICSTTFLSGCMTSQGGSAPLTKEALCFIAISATGSGVGVAIDEGPTGAGIGLLLGAGIGYFLCDADKKPVAEMPVDSDGDGVTDNNDRCPATPRGAAVNSTGCELDGDNDGVVDRMDDCRDTPRGQAVNNMGCHMIFSLEGVNFEYNSATLTNAAKTRLNEGVQMLRANSSVNINVVGHTDDRGPDSYNMNLSENRAQSVVDYLSANGISRSRMTAVGRGEGSPVASNDTASGRAQNRRVEFIVR
ncbi:MAG: OOP family OmpA-OmpF porin [Gammaproteobacteria bacterium]|jgi:OOP family OmpA-OmpF porin